MSTAARVVYVDLTDKTFVRGLVYEDGIVTHIIRTTVADTPVGRVTRETRLYPSDKGFFKAAHLIKQRWASSKH